MRLLALLSRLTAHAVRLVPCTQLAAVAALVQGRLQPLEALSGITDAALVTKVGVPATAQQRVGTYHTPPSHRPSFVLGGVEMMRMGALSSSDGSE
jgi:hypothetical protein